VVFGLYLYAINIRGLSFSNQADDVFWGVSIFACLNFGIYFLLGSLMWLYRDKVPLTLGYALVMLLLLFMAREGIAKQAVFHIAFPYLVIFIALYKKIELPIYHRIGDISYGVYIYAMPIQQAVIHFMGGKISPNKVTIYSLPIVIMLAIASWKLIEEPALKRKSS
jgi:peptidoglycan/LPS O-acetylase OafA/YrhL